MLTNNNYIDNHPGIFLASENLLCKPLCAILWRKNLPSRELSDLGKSMEANQQYTEITNL